MKLLRKAQRDQLLANGRAQWQELDDWQGALDCYPAVKSFTLDRLKVRTPESNVVSPRCRHR